MKFDWKPAKPYGIGENVWILEGRMGFLVTRDMAGKWVIFCADQTTPERKIYMHDCRDMADGKAIVEAQIRRLAN